MLFDLPDVDWRRLRWTPAAQLRKIGEEYGEVCEAVAKDDPVNIVRETLDMIQTGNTLICMVLAEYNLSMDKLLHEHREKLIAKGYIRRVD